MFILYKIQKNDLHCKSFDWFLYDENTELNWVNFYFDPAQAPKLRLVDQKKT